jgi:hypothetical protein
MCEDCGLKHASCGVPGDTKKKRWCRPCSQQHGGARSTRDLCEDCGLKRASCGVPGVSKKVRWCRPCSRQHEGARSTQSMCEDCGLKRASCGVPGDTKKVRWCGPCSRQHEGARNTHSHMCEDCGLKHASCGVPGDTKKVRWCRPCSRQHEGAQAQRKQNMCEDCGLKQSSCGVPGDTKKARWCGPCSRQHEGARSTQSRMYVDYLRGDIAPLSASVQVEQSQDAWESTTRTKKARHVEPRRDMDMQWRAAQACDHRSPPITVQSLGVKVEVDSRAVAIEHLTTLRDRATNFPGAYIPLGEVLRRRRLCAVFWGTWAACHHVSQLHQRPSNTVRGSSPFLSSVVCCTTVPPTTATQHTACCRLISMKKHSWT